MDMEATYVITPEMLGLTWRRVLLHALGAGVATIVLWTVWNWLFHAPLSTSSLISVVLVTTTCILLTRPLSRIKLQISDSNIECLGGPVIGRDEICRVNEYIAKREVSGIEIFGNRKSRWLPKYRIFVPAALPQFQDVRQVVHGWVGDQDWHTV